jgi:hypothetical protein
MLAVTVARRRGSRLLEVAPTALERTEAQWGRVAACREHDVGVVSEQSSRCRLPSFVCRLYNTGARPDPWWAPVTNCLGLENSPSTKILNSLPARKAISLMKLVENYNSEHLYSRPECHGVSEASSTSNITVAVDMLLLKFRMTWSENPLICWSVVLWCDRQVKWLALVSFFPQCVLGLFLKSISQRVCPLWVRDW